MAKVKETVTQVEVLDETEGPVIGIDVGIVLGTTLCLLTAIVFLLLALKSHYGAGPLA
jgi:tetrahydromethanopterin S-methyltransferase subunit G